MDFLELRSSRKRSAALVHLIIVVDLALTMTAFHLSYDMHRGKGRNSVGAAFSVAYLGVAYDFGFLPSLWSRHRLGWGGSLVMPVLTVLVSSYLYLTFQTDSIQPSATIFSSAHQIGTLAHLSGRS